MAGVSDKEKNTNDTTKIEVELEIIEVMDGDSCDYNAEMSRIDIEALIGAEILDVYYHGNDAGQNEIDELKVRLKDGRVIRISKKCMVLSQWSDDADVEVTENEEMRRLICMYIERG